MVINMEMAKNKKVESQDGAGQDGINPVTVELANMVIEDYTHTARGRGSEDPTLSRTWQKITQYISDMNSEKPMVWRYSTLVKSSGVSYVDSRIFQRLVQYGTVNMGSRWARVLDLGGRRIVVISAKHMKKADFNQLVDIIREKYQSP